MTEPASFSRAIAVDTWLCGSPVRAAISPTALSGCSAISLATISTIRALPAYFAAPPGGSGSASSPIFINARPSRKSSTPFTA